MSKSRFGKLLSVILAIAICCAALCGSIIGVNAVSDEYNGTYTVTVGDQNNAVPFGATKVTAQVKFDLSAGFGGGYFTIPTNADYSGISNVKVIAATPKNSANSFNAANTYTYVNAVDGGNQVEFILGNGELYTSATIEYTYDMASYVNAGAQKKYATSITNIDLGIENAYVDATVTATVDSATDFHTHSSWWGSNPTVVADKEAHKVVKANCAICGSEKGALQQVKPDYSTFDGATQFTSDQNTGWIGLSGTTVDYNADGSLNINVHGYSQNLSNTVVILVTDENGKEYYRSSDKQVSTLAGNGFKADEFMVNINNFSAKNIGEKLLITATAIYHDTENGKNDYNLLCSRTETFTLTDYCTSVIDEDAVWAENTSDAQKTSDKEVAASLLYYGASIDESVFDKTTTAPEDTTIKGTTTVTPVEKRVEAWTKGETDGKGSNNWGFSEPITEGEGTQSNPYKITNARQLAGVLLWGGDSTKDKYYKVDEKIGVFYLNLDGNNYNASTFENLKSSLSNKAKYWVTNSSYAFQGHFDGNGVEIRGLSAASESTAGLIPFVKGNVSIKNVTVTDSYLTATSRVGVIVGATAGDTALNSISFENCVVKGNYVEMTGTRNTLSHYEVAGGLAGALVAVQESASVNNCLIIDNNFVLSNGKSAYATYGNINRKGVSNGSGGWNWPVQPKYKNIITDEIPYGPSNDSYIDGVSNYTNVYTTKDISGYVYYSSLTDSNIKKIEKSEMQGANALTTMNLSSTDWFATTSYPELKVFHSLQTVSNGNNTGHKQQCAIKVNGQLCSVCGITENHTMADNEDKTYSICSACGYGEKKVTYTTAVTPVEKASDKWGWISTTSETEPYYGFANPEMSLLNSELPNSETNPYIIETAEQLAAIALYGYKSTNGLDTADKYYKVSDNVKELVLSDVEIPSGAQPEQLKTTLSSAKSWSTSGNYAFQGHFDGNGVIIRGMRSNAGSAGLFPYVKGDVSIKNVTVTDSYLSGTAFVGGIVGTASDWNLLSNITIENCIVKNNYMEMTSTSAQSGAWYVIGGLAGSFASPTNSVKINNCMVVNNTMTNANGGNTYGFVAAVNQGSNVTYTFSNLLTDEVAYTSDSTVLVDKAANYSNVYTTQTIPSGEISDCTDANVKTLTKSQMQGANALTTMNLSSNDWFATTSYPELKVFHSLQTLYTDDSTHTPTCAITIGGKQCTVCGVAEQHTTGTCACGYVSTASISISELLTEKYSADVSQKVLAVLNDNTTYTSKFESNSKFVAAYTEDNNPTDSTSNLYLYATSLNLKTTPHIMFTFAFLGDYMTNPSSVNITFTCGDLEPIVVSGDKLIHNQGAGRYFAYRLKELPIVNLKDQITVTVNNENFGTYSAAGFAISAINYGPEYAYHAQAAKAIVLYSEMLAARKSLNA